MAQIPQLNPTTTLDSSDETILRQGTTDKRISLELANTLAWAKREGYSYQGEYQTGVVYSSTEQFYLFDSKPYFVEDNVSLPYTTTISSPEDDSNLYIKNEVYFLSKTHGANLLSNHNFLVQSPDSITPPSSTPTDYVEGTQIFSGVFVGTDITGLTYVNGRVSFLSGDLYFSRANEGGLEYVTQFTASVADFDGKPRTRGVSFALVGDEYRVTVGIDALEDVSATATPLGSVKFEQGSVATKHEVVESISDLGGKFAFQADSVGGMVAGKSLNGQSTAQKIGQVWISGSSRWLIVKNPTYTLPYENRIRVFNNLQLDSGLYAHPVGSTIFAADFLNEAVDASNDEEVGKIAAIMRDGLRLDFSGKMYRVYSGNTGIPSGSADPVTDRAQSLDNMLALIDLENITFGSGGLYAADQSTASTKSYFPSTLYLKQCKDTHFEAGSLFEAKGESWGDSDASSGLSADDRQDFVGQNGGHAIALVRCQGATGVIHGRLAGSSAVIYAPSTTGVNAKLIANAASLGYACYNPDAWCGSPSVVGIVGDTFTHQIDNPRFEKETLTRREDGASVGNSLYAGKAGITVEDECDIIGSGGFFADMWANGSFKYLGAAITVGGRSTVNWVGGKVRRCQEIVMLGTSTASTAICNWENVDAQTGLTGIMLTPVSFGAAEARITGKLRVDNSRVWAGEPPELSETSVVSNSKVTSSAVISIELDAAGAEEPEGGSTGILQNISVNTERACYGGFEITGGKIITDGHFLKSVGWGATGAGSRYGFVVIGGAVLRDLGIAVTDPNDSLIQYQNEDPVNTFSFVYHDYEDCKIISDNARRLDGYTLTGGASLLEEIRIPRETDGAISLRSSPNPRPRETTPVKPIAVGGLSGPNRLYTMAFLNNRVIRSGVQLSSNAGLNKILAVGAASIVGDEIHAVITFEGDPFAQYTDGGEYFALGG